mgnify:CR=1 FL=1
MVRSSEFWLLYAMFVMVAASGLMATAQVAPIAKFYGVDKVQMLFGMTALVMAVEVDRILNGVTRPFWGWVSDHIGRENTMAIAFGLQGAFIFLWMSLTSNPATVGDLFGSKYATTTYGILYPAKGVASIFAGPLAALLFAAAHSWAPIFLIAMAVNFITAALALFVLKPLTAKYVRVVEAPRPEPKLA